MVESPVKQKRVYQVTKHRTRVLSNLLGEKLSFRDMNHDLLNKKVLNLNSIDSSERKRKNNRILSFKKVNIMSRECQQKFLLKKKFKNQQILNRRKSIVYKGNNLGVKYSYRRIKSLPTIRNIEDKASSPTLKIRNRFKWSGFFEKSTFKQTSKISNYKKSQKGTRFKMMTQGIKSFNLTLK